MPRRPEPELIAQMEAIVQAAKRVGRREADLRDARHELAEVIQQAHAAGLSYAVIGRLLGVSRQRAQQLSQR